MQEFLVTIKNAVWNLFNRPTVLDFIDIFIVAYIIYKLILLLQETRASALVKGIMVLLFATLASKILGLTSLNWLLLTVLNNGVIVIVILFQPEIRKILEHLGLGTFRDTKSLSKNNKEFIDNIIEAVVRLSKRRVGALIVFEQSVGIKDIIQTGTYIDSNISSRLIENVFEPNTPLHDGALVIRGDRIVAAACILNLTQNNEISKDLGTRHRAALGVTEVSDAISLIVSEETGVISMAHHGKLIRHLDREELRHKLNEMYEDKKEKGLKSLIKSLFIRNTND